MKAKCLKCNYSWESKGQLERITCPNCGKKVKLNKVEEDEPTRSIEFN